MTKQRQLGDIVAQLEHAEGQTSCAGGSAGGGRRIGRVKTTADFIPGSDQAKDTVVADFRRYQAELMTLVRDARGPAVDRGLECRANRQ